MSIKQDLYNEIRRHKWELAIIKPEEFDEDLGISKAHFVKNPYKNKWFADPFILDVTDENLEVLVEEFDRFLKRGRIAKLSISKTSYRIVSMKIILDLETHLSFPAIMRNGGEVFIYPENSASGCLQIYRYNQVSDELTNCRILVNKPVTDAIIYNNDDCQCILATELPNPNGNVLKVFSPEDGSENLNCFQEIRFESNIARNGGDFFYYYGKKVRPAQICDGGYGMGLSLQELEIKDRHFSFHETYRLLPPKGYTGLHTYNQFKGFGIIDCRRYVHRSVLSFLHKLKHFV